ncbi:MAG: alpha-L-glutamate ligase-like protein [Spirochaetia bacterium]|jgi:alpha-L-glutamate ligase-like protein|nr:alpha-L-glutamate ligase-like protein [Spirochaetia bacterium]
MNLDSILSINKRNLDVISVYNPRKSFPLVDDKIRTKVILETVNVPFPETIAVVQNFFEIEDVFKALMGKADFVVKPARGRAGGGILLVEKNGDETWRTPSGRSVDKDDMKTHFGDILFGVYSFGRMDDRVLIEKKVIPDDFMYNIYTRGIPDIRIIAFKDKPVMAMLRIPTDQSDGKANLHQGAIGVSIDMETGITGSSVMNGKRIEAHPDSGVSISGLQIPFWKEILKIAKSSSLAVPLEYIGVDIVIDRDLGPMVLELNARPGLQIQVVNRMGLLPQLEGVQK